MKDVSSDEEGEDVDLPTEITDLGNERRNERLAQKEKLRKMMESSDDDEAMGEAEEVKLGPDAVAMSEADIEVDEEEEKENEEVEEQPSAPIDASNKSAKNSKEAEEEEGAEEPAITVSGGRRRGRRKVMKKKTRRDAEGYIGVYFMLPCACWSHC